MTTQNLLRLALRVEGDWWVAYAAMPDTMEGAQELGRVLMVLVQKPKRKKTWMDFMRDSLTDLIRAATGLTPSGYETRKASEHERSGRA